ncbi:hypothetical protein D3C85_1046590 [compost metagenome]
MSVAIGTQQLQWRRAQIQRHCLQPASSKIFLAWIGSHYCKTDALPRARHSQFSAVDAVAAADWHLDDVAVGILKLPRLSLQCAQGGNAGQGFEFAHLARHASLG